MSRFGDLTSFHLRRPDWWGRGDLRRAECSKCSRDVGIRGRLQYLCARDRRKQSNDQRFPAGQVEMLVITKLRDAVLTHPTVMEGLIPLVASEPSAVARTANPSA